MYAGVVEVSIDGEELEAAVATVDVAEPEI